MKLFDVIQTRLARDWSSTSTPQDGRPSYSRCFGSISSELSLGWLPVALNSRLSFPCSPSELPQRHRRDVQHQTAHHRGGRHRHRGHHGESVEDENKLIYLIYIKSCIVSSFYHLQYKLFKFPGVSWTRDLDAPPSLCRSSGWSSAWCSAAPSGDPETSSEEPNARL